MAIGDKIEFFSKHVVILSALAFGLSTACIIAFLGAYLSVFDARLIWILEYTDIWKFVLLGSFLIVAIIIFANNNIGNIVSIWDTYNTKQKRYLVFVIYFSSILAVINSFFINKYTVIVIAMLVLYSLATAFLLYVSIDKMVSAFRNKDYSFRNMITPIVFLLATIALHGSLFGFYVKSKEDIKTNIKTKSNTYHDYQIVMILSHHTILYKNENTIIIPADQVEYIGIGAGPF